MSATAIAGIEVPSSSLIRDVTELVRSSSPPLLFTTPAGSTSAVRCTAGTEA